MATAKKKCLYGITAQQDERGAWGWTTESMGWTWGLGGRINLSLIFRGRIVPFAFAGTLKEAILYSKGVEAGFHVLLDPSSHDEEKE